MKRIAGIALVLVGAALAVPEAGATCVTPNPNGKPSVAGFRTAFAHPSSTASVDAEPRGSIGIVGLWLATYLDPAGAVWNQGFQQWHSDGTELSIDNAVPPSLGNVCIGVYKQTGPRSYTLRHVTWNWTSDGQLAGTFLLITTLTLDANGNVFSGTYVTDSFDLAGDPIPALHAEGPIRGTRITVD